MANVATKGLASLKIGNIAGDGGMGTSLAIIGYVEKGSLSVTRADGTETEFFAEEVDQAVETSYVDGALSITWTLLTPDLTQYAAVMGGTVTGTSPNFVYNAPTITPVIEQSLEITPVKGNDFAAPRVQLRAKPSGGYTKDGLFKIEVTAKVLTPTKANEPLYKSKKVA